MDQNGHMIDQKVLEMYEKWQKIELLDQKYLLFSGTFLSGIDGFLLPPDNDFALKSLAELGSTPPPQQKVVYYIPL